MGPEIWHPHHWHIQHGVLWGEVLVRHCCVLRAPLRKPVRARVVTTRLMEGISGCGLHTH